MVFRIPMEALIISARYTSNWRENLPKLMVDKIEKTLRFLDRSPWKEIWSGHGSTNVAVAKIIKP